MGKITGIAYVDHTRNYWSGCRKVGPGCDGCYAEAFQRRIRGKHPVTGEAANWGDGERVSHLDGASRDVRRWNRNARKAGVRRRIFINTMSDTFDNEVPQSYRDHIWGDVWHCTSLEFLFVTKRIGNVSKMVPFRWMQEGFPDHVRILITVVNQEEADRDIGKLLALPCKNGISYEPALGPVDWSPWLWPVHAQWPTRFRTPEEAIAAGEKVEYKRQALVSAHRNFLQWGIVGGESDQGPQKARPFHLTWARNMVYQFRIAGSAPFVKQLGSAAYGALGIFDKDVSRLIVTKDRAGADPTEWPEDLRVQEFPA